MPESTKTNFSPANYFSKGSNDRLESEFTVDMDNMKHIVPHPNPIKISYGDPDYEFYPIHSLDVAVKSDPFQIDDHSGYIMERIMADETKLELKKAMSYHWTTGHKSLLGFLKEFIVQVFPPGYEDWDVICTTGGGNGLNKAIETIVSSDEVVLVEEFTYPPFLLNVKEVGGISIPIKLNIQDGGIDYEYLKDLLENWDTIHPGKNKPKCLYTIPTGQNPMGFSQSLDLRKKIYQLAVLHDFLIIEDDPYGYITLPPYQEHSSNEDLTKEEYLKTLATSYLTLDTMGRVVRIETFSKVFAPGLRLGYMIAHKDFTSPLGIFAGIATGTPSGASQALVNNTINHLGGVDGWINWLIKLRKEYVHRRDVMLSTLYSSSSFKNKQITVIDPAAGMFVAVIINFNTSDVTEYSKLLEKLVHKTIVNGVNIVTGPKLLFDKSFSAPRSNFVRLTVASVENDEELIEATRRFTSSVSQLFEDLKN